MEAWNNFFLGELGAAAALAGLLFVSVSVNQARILTLGRMADRGIESLAMLFLVLAMASLGLMPKQPPRWFGLEVLALSAMLFARLVPLQRSYLGHIDVEDRPRTLFLVRGTRAAVGVIALAGAIMLVSDDVDAMYLLVPGILGTFVAALASAWVLLVEINR